MMIDGAIYYLFYRFPILNWNILIHQMKLNTHYNVSKVKLLLLPMVILLSSCSAIFYGTSTDVMVASPEQGEVVNIFAIGPKDTVRYNTVTLPYTMKVKHNNLPLRVTVETAENTVENFTIGAVAKGKKLAKLGKTAAWSVLGATAFVGVIITSFTDPVVGLYVSSYYAAMSVPFFVLGYTTETNIPDAPEYFTDTKIVSNKEIKPSIMEYEVDDVYNLLSDCDYTMAELKANYLISKKETAELYYLRGVTYYNLRKQKKAVQDLEKAYSMTNSSKDFQLQNAIVEALRKASNRKTWRKEKTIVAIKPEKYTDTL